MRPAQDYESTAKGEAGDLRRRLSLMGCWKCGEVCGVGRGNPDPSVSRREKVKHCPCQKRIPAAARANSNNSRSFPPNRPCGLQPPVVTLTSDRVARADPSFPPSPTSLWACRSDRDDDPVTLLEGRYATTLRARRRETLPRAGDGTRPPHRPASEVGR